MNLVNQPAGLVGLDGEGRLTGEWASAVDAQEIGREQSTPAEVRECEAESHRGEGFSSRVETVPPAADAMDLNLIARSTANVMVTACEAAERVAWARWIRDRGHRHGPFVVVRPGLDRQVRAAEVDEWFTRAAGGTLFIDCVGHLGTNAQARLSARLDEQSRHVNGVTPLNGEDCVRVITGNHRSLHENLAVGAFDDTLFYRLNVIHINRMRGDEAGEHCMKARDVMSQPPYICGPDTDLASVAKIMWDHDCGFVPVVDASGTVAGAVTDRDICIATSTRRLLPEQISAAQVMTSPIHACLPDDEISDVLATMKQSQIRRLPVIGADGRLRGVISLNDLVLASTDKREPRAADVIATIAAIGAHRRTAALA